MMSTAADSEELAVSTFEGSYPYAHPQNVDGKPWKDMQTIQGASPPTAAPISPDENAISAAVASLEVQHRNPYGKRISLVSFQLNVARHREVVISDRLRLHGCSN
jgi:hypothetical protein